MNQKQTLVLVKSLQADKAAEKEIVSKISKLENELKSQKEVLANENIKINSIQTTIDTADKKSKSIEDSIKLKKQVLSDASNKLKALKK